MDDTNGISTGLLISTDIPTKQIIMYVNEANGGRIILKDLDDCHVLIDSRYKDFLNAQVEQLFNKNTYERKQQMG
jgi:hypothetical protein